MSAEKPIRFSHADYIAEKMHRAVMALRYEDGFPVARLAELAGCSESLIYTWANLDGFMPTAGKYLFAMASGLAERHGNYRLIQLLLPVGVRVSVSKDIPLADGSCDDEHLAGSLALAQAVQAHRGKNADAIREARDQLMDVARRLEQEEAVLRQSTEG